MITSHEAIINEELARFVWPGAEVDVMENTGRMWVVDKEKVIVDGKLFTRDQGLCCEWLIPKVSQFSGIGIQVNVLLTRLVSGQWGCILSTYKEDIAFEEARHYNPAMSISKAVLKLIREDNKS